MKIVRIVTALLLTAACAQQPQSSLGDSPIRHVRCPTFLDHKTCVARAERECGGEVTVVARPAEGDIVGEGSTVPIEGRIEYRTITVRCEV